MAFARRVTYTPADYPLAQSWEIDDQVQEVRQRLPSAS